MGLTIVLNVNNWYSYSYFYFALKKKIFILGILKIMKYNIDRQTFIFYLCIISIFIQYELSYTSVITELISNSIL